jgi:hypothetical protein
MAPNTKNEPKRPHTVIGWREKISLPDLDLIDFAVKVDTGARTTALHAADVETFEKDGEDWVRFTPDFCLGNAGPREEKIHERREITNTSGVPEERMIIRTRLLIAGRTWKIDVSLADRAPMRFPLILGRSALRGHNISVHTGRSYLVSERPENPEEF